MGGTELLIAGAVTSAAGSLFTGFSTMAAMEHQSDIAHRNATFQKQLGERNARVALEQGRVERARLRRQNRRRIASFEAQAAGSGFTAAGSPTDVLLDMMAEARQDEKLITYGAQTAAQQARLTGELQRITGYERAAALETEGVSRAIGGSGQAGGSLLTGFVDDDGTSLFNTGGGGGGAE
jgi:hypothetical protein